jgi:hypothetical protein
MATSFRKRRLDFVKYVENIENTISTSVQTSEYKFVSSRLYLFTQLKGREKDQEERDWFSKQVFYYIILFLNQASTSLHAQFYSKTSPLTRGLTHTKKKAAV